LREALRAERDGEAAYFRRNERFEESYWLLAASSW